MAPPHSRRHVKAQVCTLTLVACLALLSGAAQAAQTVIIMRHCARTTPDNVNGAPGFNFAQNYTAKPWPAWPDNLPPYLCLPHGVEIVRGSGRWLAANANLASPIAITADDVQRDRTTAAAVADGMGWNGKVFDDHGPFASACAAPAASVADAAIAANLKAHPKPADYDAKLALLQGITGQGAAPPLADIAEDIEGGDFNGGPQVAQYLTERLLMELGGNMSVGWGTKVNIYDILELHSWQRHVERVVPKTQANYGASITWNVLNSLSDGTPGTQFFVGHDETMWSLAATIGLTWTPAGLPVLPTVPGSILRFDLDGDSVTSTYMYPLFTDTGADTGKLYSAPVTFTAVGSTSIPMSNLTKVAQAGINMECVVFS